MEELAGGVGLGTFPFAGAFGPITRRTSIDLLKQWLDGGGSYVDTSPTYALGDVERLLGEVLARVDRDRVVVGSSCGYVRDGDGFRVSGRREDVIADCDESLQRLGLEHLDIYISHIPDPATPFEETIGAMMELQAAGKVRRIGVSNVSLDQLVEYVRWGDVSIVQNRFSYLNRALGDDLQAYCERAGIGIVAYQVVERGLLTGRAPSELSPDSADLRSRKPEFDEQVRAFILQWGADNLVPLANELDMTVAQLVIAWTRDQPGICLCQVGATRSSQIDGLLTSRDRALDSSTLNDLDLRYDRLAAAIRDQFGTTVRGLMGLEDYDVYGGSASGR